MIVSLSSRVAGLKASEVVARALVEEVLEKDLPDGAPLTTEKELIERFGVSRGTLREALRILESRGLVTIRPGPGGGLTVRRPRPTDLVEPLSVFLNYADASAVELMVARRFIEPEVAARSALNPTETLLDQLEETIEAMREPGCDEKTFLDLNLQFHETLAQSCDNSVLGVLSASLNELGQRARSELTYGPERMHHIADAHERIVDCMRARDEDGAREEMRAHLDEVVQFWQEKYEQIPIPLRWIR